MVKKLDDFVITLEKWLPLSWAEAWDNVGLQIEPGDSCISKILISLDPGFSVLREAEQVGAQMVLAHHPLIFHPLRQIVGTDPTASLVRAFIEKGIGLYVAHTNFDCGFLVDAVANRMNLNNWTYFARVGGDKNPDRCEPDFDEDIYFDNQRPNKTARGFGAIGKLAKPLAIRELFLKLQNIFPVETMRASNWQIGKVQKVAIVPGSGGKFLDEANMLGAEVFISGDFDYHEYRYAESLGMYLIDLGHYQLEIMSKEVMARNLKNIFGDEVACVIATETAESFYVAK